MPPKSLKTEETWGFQPIDAVYRKSDAKGLYLKIRPKVSKHWFVKYRIHGSEKGCRLEVGLRCFGSERRDDSKMC